MFFCLKSSLEQAKKMSSKGTIEAGVHVRRVVQNTTSLHLTRIWVTVSWVTAISWTLQIMYVIPQLSKSRTYLTFTRWYSRSMHMNINLLRHSIDSRVFTFGFRRRSSILLWYVMGTYCVRNGYIMIACNGFALRAHWARNKIKQMHFFWVVRILEKLCMYNLRWFLVVLLWLLWAKNEKKY